MSRLPRRTAAFIGLRPDRARHRGNLGLALLKARRPADAAAEFVRVLEEEPADVETRSRLGLALAQQGKLEEASVEFGRVVEAAPRDLIGLTHLGLVLTDLGRPAEAVSYLERAVMLEPTSAVLRGALARARNATAARPRP